MPTALGGSDNPDNLVTACRDCNAGKASTHPDESTVNDVAGDAERWARARQQAADELTNRRAAIEDQFTVFYLAWTKWDKNAAYLPTNADTTFSNWLNRGLTLDDVLEAHTIALGARHVSVYRVWRYMCGVLRRRVSEIDTIASNILDSED
jgi:hypothetical protein